LRVAIHDVAPVQSLPLFDLNAFQFLIRKLHSILWLRSSCCSFWLSVS
jgi:hypothetical protein